MHYEEREAQLRHWERGYYEMKYKLESENAALKAELAAAKKDAERYRWLRDRGCQPTLEKSLLVISGKDVEHSLLPEELDAAIDAELEKTK